MQPWNDPSFEPLSQLPEQPAGHPSLQPFEIHFPGDATVPILFDSPHSGRSYPTDFGASATLSDLRRGEDAYLDELLLGAESLGISLLLATYHRCYLDLNREADDIDPLMLEGAWPTPLSPTEKSERGLGLIRRLVVPGVPIYDRFLSVDEVRHRIEDVYLPYHAALRELRARLLEDLGYKVAVNVPYAGGMILREMGDPVGRVHSIQIEMNRGLYLDEVPVEKTEGFGRLRLELASFFAALVEAAG